MKKNIIIMLLILGVFPTVFATSIQDLLPNVNPVHIDALKEGKIIDVITTSSDSICGVSTIEDMGTNVDFSRDYPETVLSIAPEGSKGKAVAEKSNNLDQGFYVGFLALLPYPESMKEMTDKQKQVKVFDTITNISTQAGITYNSFTEGNKEVPLFIDAYVISNPKDMKSRVNDPKMLMVPKTYTCYSYQKDNRFGKNVYKITFQNSSDEIFMDICNITTMKFTVIPCVEKESLHMYLDIIQTDEGILLYSMAKIENRDPVVKILKFEVDLPTSFLRRITALGKWFKINIYE